MKNAGVKMVFLPTQQGAYISNIAQEMKQRASTPCCSAGPTPMRGLRPRIGRQRHPVHGDDRPLHGRGRQGGAGGGHLRQVGQEGRPPDPARPLHRSTPGSTPSCSCRPSRPPGANPTRAGLEAQLNKVTSFNANGLIPPRTRPRRSPGSAGSSPSTKREVEAHPARTPSGLRLQPGGASTHQTTRASLAEQRS